jgi:hypothetical protein
MNRVFKIDQFLVSVIDVPSLSSAAVTRDCPVPADRTESSLYSELCCMTLQSDWLSRHHATHYKKSAEAVVGLYTDARISVLGGLELSSSSQLSHGKLDSFFRDIVFRIATPCNIVSCTDASEQNFAPIVSIEQHYKHRGL